MTVQQRNNMQRKSNIDPTSKEWDIVSVRSPLGPILISRRVRTGKALMVRTAAAITRKVRYA